MITASVMKELISCLNHGKEILESILIGANGKITQKESYKKTGKKTTSTF